MTRSRLRFWLPGFWLPVVLGGIAMLGLQACGGSPTSHAADLPGEAAKTDVKAEEAQVTLYMTTWCGYCRKTQDLLEQLDVRYVAKDIESSPEAAREYRSKVGDYRGIPVLDIDGEIVKGFRADRIEKLVTRLKERRG